MGTTAQLNYGDTFPYALASVTGKPLLYAGSDFSATDVRRAGGAQAM
ncbi:MAG TPA: type II toxin-antitoxin system VapC family toxin [Candidatus Nesterenkonia stercoripullorum]|uniref:Type II toxin-antitoxin system VapC family toxin n=1 Tax=Candidatus Nesterenkonia stercoripullorum TaxID=2838701 RepID=A0A9D1S358_9MICC|nr:type II toxin-antitoxin system VapC family toxin [Candidatus Nesterenkonia stercoripullorum]